MTFDEALSKYINIVGCSSKELSQRSGVSQAAISRYKSGQRTPTVSSSAPKKLAEALSALAKENGVKLKNKEINKEFTASLNAVDFDTLTFTHNLNSLFNILEINTNDLAKAINYDPSLLSRIKSMQRKPSDVVDFSEKVASYVVKHYTNPESIKTIKQLIGKEHNLQPALVEYLTGGKTESDDFVGGFLSNLDEFNFNEYLNNSEPWDSAVVEAHSPLTEAKFFYGKSQIQQAELCFLNEVLLSKSTEPVYLQNSMPLSEIAKDIDFSRKWAYSVTKLLRKGLKINIIHDINRPIKEMLFGIELWIPLYMTGLITPYYIRKNGAEILRYTNYVSGDTALSGESFGNKLDNTRYYITKDKDELEYYKRKTSYILKSASPLLNIYTNKNSSAFRVSINYLSLIKANRNTINSSLPVCTLNDDLIESLAKTNGFSEEETEILREASRQMLNRVKKILKTNIITERIPKLTREEFEKNPLKLSASGTFFERNISYTFEQYTEHLRLTEEFSANNKNFIIKENQRRSFNNLTITVIEQKSVIISKLTYPNIHFVINQPQLVNAIENYISYYSDENDNIV